MNNIFDSHAHYDDEAFDEDRDSLLTALNNGGVVGIINCGCSMRSNTLTAALSKKYPFVYAAYGIHPQNCGDFDGSAKDIKKTLLPFWNDRKCVAVGEIGLDYHYDFSPRDRQIEFFTEQVRLSIELDLPVIVHDREAHEDTMNILKKYKPKGVMHCFSGSVEMASELLKLGMYIGLGGAVTFKNARKSLEVALMVPPDRLLVETDCPYMTPVPFRGHRNDSSLIEHTALKIAEIRNVTAQSVLDMTYSNASELFGIRH